jgi:hypothetical protein
MKFSTIKVLVNCPNTQTFHQSFVMTQEIIRDNTVFPAYVFSKTENEKKNGIIN